MNTIEQILSKQREFFKTQATKDIVLRKKTLKALKKELISREQDIISALYKDFKKPRFESILSETEIVLHELNTTIENLNSWAKPKRVKASFLNFPSSDYIHSEPYGTVLCIGPWNYPYQLTLAPAIAAIAAGNTVVIKPSELTPNTSQLVEEIFTKIFKQEHVAVINGGIPVATKLLGQRWDYIFFTGSVPVGKIVAKAAAVHLTPTTLELGGKSPCIIDQTANIKLTAKRLVWGKFLNAGQTCIAPDYIIIHKDAKHSFYKAFKTELEKAYTKNPKQSEDFARIINEKNFLRLTKMLEDQSIVIGGEVDKTDLYIAPTLIDEPDLDSDVMRDEIFGPILPVISYESKEDIDRIISNYEKPLSFYVFSNSKSLIKKLMRLYSFGGGVINDTLIHFANDKLPFGGVGHSGMGAYHGKASFDTFSHKKPIVKKANWLDVPVRYAPYNGKEKLIKFFLKYF